MTGAIERYIGDLAGPMGALDGPGGRPLLAAFAALHDEVADRQLAAVRAGRLPTAPSDAIDHHARTRGFGRVRSESDESLRRFLLGGSTAPDGVFTYYREMGSTDGLQRQLARLGYANVRVTTALDLYFAGVAGAFGLQPGLIGPFGGYPGFLFLEIDLDNGFGLAPDWDGAADWDGSALWDLKEPYQGAIDEIRETIWRWKAFGRSCRYVRVRAGSEWLSIPVGERWEWDADGNVTGPYLTDFMVE